MWMDKGSLVQLIPCRCHVENYDGKWEVVLSMVSSGSQVSAEFLGRSTLANSLPVKEGGRDW